jgi:hypothetical protein
MCSWLPWSYQFFLILSCLSVVWRRLSDESAEIMPLIHSNSETICWVNWFDEWPTILSKAIVRVQQCSWSRLQSLEELPKKRTCGWSCGDVLNLKNDKMSSELYFYYFSSDKWLNDETGIFKRFSLAFCWNSSLPRLSHDTIWQSCSPFPSHFGTRCACHRSTSHALISLAPTLALPYEMS